MNIRNSISLMKSAVALTGGGLCLLMSPGRVWGQSASAIPQIRVKVFANAGGLTLPEAKPSTKENKDNKESKESKESKDAKGSKDMKEDSLNVQFTRGLEDLLTSNAKGRYLVESHGKDVKSPETGAIHLTLEGDLSHLENGGQNGGGSYLCAVRLFRDGKTRKMIGHWAGYARTFRDVSDNVQRDPNIHPGGLIGEISTRVTDILVHLGTGSVATRFEKFVKEHPDKGSKMAAVLVTPGHDNPQPLHDPATEGDGFRVQVNVKETGELYIVGSDAHGHPGLMLNRETHGPLIVSAAKPLLAPDVMEPPFNIEAAESTPNREIIVLLRTLPRSTSVPNPNHVLNGSGSSGLHLENNRENETESALRSICQATKLKSDAQSVVILDGGTAVDTSVSPSDSGIERILTMAEQDPAGSWTAVRLKIKTVPAKVDKEKSGLWEALGRGGITDNRVLLLSRNPDKSPVVVKDRFRLQARAAKDGYLLLVAMNSQGTIDLLAPNDKEIPSAKVAEGEMVLFPTRNGQSYIADRPGKERTRVLLLSSEKEATQMVEWLKAVKANRTKAAPRRPELAHPYYISDITFDVAPAS